MLWWHRKAHLKSNLLLDSYPCSRSFACRTVPRLPPACSALSPHHPLLSLSESTLTLGVKGWLDHRQGARVTVSVTRDLFWRLDLTQLGRNWQSEGQKGSGRERKWASNQPDHLRLCPALGTQGSHCSLQLSPLWVLSRCWARVCGGLAGSVDERIDDWYGFTPAFHILCKFLFWPIPTCKYTEKRFWGQLFQFHQVDTASSISHLLRETKKSRFIACALASSHLYSPPSPQPFLWWEIGINNNYLVLLLFLLW